MCPTTESCYVCGLSGLPHIEDIPVSVLSCPCSSAYVQVCVCVPPAAAPGDSQGKTCCCGTKSLKEPLLSSGEQGWVQPRPAPPALISGERMKCGSLGIFLVVVRAERQQWKTGEGGGRQRKRTTFLGADKRVACLGSGQSLF